MSKRIVVLHHDDNDGCCAAWVVSHYYNMISAPYQTPNRDYEVITIPVQYGSPPPFKELTPDTILYIVDFSYKRDQLLTLQEMVKEIHVFDHHATAEAELSDLPFAKFSKDKAGAGMTWDILLKDLQVPYVVQLVDDYDLWKFEHKDTKAFHAISHLHDTRSMEFWNNLHFYPEYRQKLLDRGHEKLYFEDIEVNNITNSSKIKLGKYTTPTKDYKVAIYQTTHNLSKVGEALLKKHEDIDFTICWFIVPAEGNVVFSLRTNNSRDLDLGEVIAKPLGGGGHRNAAGFNLPISGGLSLVDMLYAS